MVNFTSWTVKFYRTMLVGELRENDSGARRKHASGPTSFEKLHSAKPYYIINWVCFISVGRTVKLCAGAPDRFIIAHSGSLQFTTRLVVILYAKLQLI